MRDLGSIILTRQELRIMKVIWERGSATVKDVCTALCREKPTAYTTILTLMGILEHKGALTHLRSGRAYVYRPLLSRGQATRNQVRDVINRFFEGQADKLIEDVVSNELSDPVQIGSILNLLESRVA